MMGSIISIDQHDNRLYQYLTTNCNFYTTFVFAEDMVGGVVSLSGMTVEIMAVPVLSCIDPISIKSLSGFNFLSNVSIDDNPSVAVSILIILFMLDSGIEDSIL